MGEGRKVAAILAADVVGYSRLTGADEEATLARMRALRRELFNPAVEAHGGRVVKRMGDGAIVEFRSVVEAVRCAIEVTKGLAERNAGVPTDRRIEVRTGIHLGDVVEEADGDLLGDGVNIAARLEGICESGGVFLSEDAWRQVRDKLPEPFVDLGERRLKNIARPMRTFALAGASRNPPAIPAADVASLAPPWRERRSARAFVDAVVREARQHRATYRGLRRQGRGHGEPGGVRTAGDDARSLAEHKRNRRLRRAIIAAAILTVLGTRACTERQSVAPPPAPSPPHAGALDDTPAAPRLATNF